MSAPPLAFSALAPPRLGPRLGTVAVARGDPLDTPALLTATSRGTVPHLSRDHARAPAVRWVHVPFESFLEHTPPAPTRFPARAPLAGYLGFTRPLLSLVLRDPHDARPMPPNGPAHVAAQCLRGVRKVSPADWSAYARACRPDAVLALSDTPLTPPPHSQKRLAKSVARSAAWLADLLAAAAGPRPFAVLVGMAGGASAAARAAFAAELVAPLDGREAALVAPLRCLDEGVAGYVFDLVPLKAALQADARATDAPIASDVPAAADPAAADVDALIPLLRASLGPLPAHKLRLVTGAASPHETLRLLAAVGADAFDAPWAQRAADIGVALDFRFPAAGAFGAKAPAVRAGGRRDLGHNLYDAAYAHDFARFAEAFRDGAGAAAAGAGGAGTPVCPCAACSPVRPTAVPQHSIADAGLDADAGTGAGAGAPPPHTRAYVHHLLHTHEMSAHALLVLHNLAVADAFFAGVRGVLRAGGAGALERAGAAFAAAYEEGGALLGEARAMWREVEMARGKGRLARERARKEAEAGTLVPEDAVAC